MYTYIDGLSDDKVCRSRVELSFIHESPGGRKKEEKNIYPMNECNCNLQFSS